MGEGITPSPCCACQSGLSQPLFLSPHSPSTVPAYQSTCVPISLLAVLPTYPAPHNSVLLTTSSSGTSTCLALPTSPNMSQQKWVDCTSVWGGFKSLFFLILGSFCRCGKSPQIWRSICFPSVWPQSADLMICS